MVILDRYYRPRLEYILFVIQATISWHTTGKKTREVLQKGNPVGRVHFCPPSAGECHIQTMPQVARLSSS
jgi:hypothetical protein